MEKAEVVSAFSIKTTLVIDKFLLTDVLAKSDLNELPDHLSYLNKFETYRPIAK